VPAADTLGVIAQDTGRIGRLLAFWDICRARDLAWDFANHLWSLDGLSRDLGSSRPAQAAFIKKE
jgi:hypothetical protein